MSTHDLHHLAAAYALDALSADERREFEAHYPSCEVCNVEVRRFRETAGVLAADTATAPPPDLKSRVMADVSRTRQLPPVLPDRVIDLAERRRNRVGRATLLATAAAVLVALVGTAVAIRTGSRSDDIGDLVAAPDAVVLPLEDTDAAPGQAGAATLRVVWSAERGELAILGQGLDQVAEGSMYELWFLLDGETVAPAALFRPDGDGTVRTFLELDDAPPSAPLGWGVTIEPAGGSPQPTSDVLFAGSI